MEIPCDGLVIEANEVQCDESAMTGETEPMIKCTISECIAKKNEFLQSNPDGKSKASHNEIPSPLILSGSRVLQGEGKFVVFVVGTKSCLGKIKEKLETETESTPLQQKLEHLARGIGKFGLISAIMILLVLLIRFAAERIEQDNFYKETHWAELISYVLIAVF
jgi:magnesium-transporting ATPase (P-type)